MCASSSAACPACGDSGAGDPLEVPDHEYGLAQRARYRSCQGCGSEYQVPMPSVDALSAFYPETYHSMQAGGALQRMRHDLRLRRLVRLLDRDGVLLDYGCGDGQFLLRAAEKMPGRRFFGYEIAEQRERQELAGGAVTLVRGRLEDLLEVLPACALATMNHVIEHLPDPAAVLEALVERLVPGGVVEGQTPATRSLEQRVFGTFWSGYHAPRHTVIFSRPGLERLFARTGLVTAEVRAAFNPAGLALSLGSLPHGRAQGVVRRQGPIWLGLLGAATLLAPIDLLSGHPSVVDFAARKLDE